MHLREREASHQAERPQTLSVAVSDKTEPPTKDLPQVQVEPRVVLLR
jgi:hypothetical protein